MSIAGATPHPRLPTSPARQGKPHAKPVRRGAPAGCSKYRCARYRLLSFLFLCTLYLNSLPVVLDILEARCTIVGCIARYPQRCSWRYPLVPPSSPPKQPSRWFPPPNLPMPLYALLSTHPSLASELNLRICSALPAAMMQMSCPCN